MKRASWTANRFAAWALWAFCAIGALSTSSCTLLWVFQNDPEGLPCDENGLCLDGYTCVKRTGGELPVCLRDGARKRGEPCFVSDQCEEGLACGSGFLPCLESPDDPNCSLVDPKEIELACRPRCDINTPTTCATDERCVDQGEFAICQVGSCASDSDCQAVAGAAGFCEGEAIVGGKTGLCFEACDPLRCDPNSKSCPDCTGTDGEIDPALACQPLLDTGPGVIQTVCKFPGTVREFATCAPFGEPCVAGSFCNAQFDPPVCTPWCNRSASLCDSPQTCLPLSQSSDLGFCG